MTYCLFNCLVNSVFSFNHVLVKRNYLTITDSTNSQWNSWGRGRTENEEAQAFFYCLYPIELGYTNYLHIIYVVKSSRDDLIATGGDMHIACVCTMLYGKLYYIITWASKDFLIYKVPQTKSFVNTNGPKSFLYILLLMLVLLKLSWALLSRHPSRVLLSLKLLVYNHWAYR